MNIRPAFPADLESVLAVEFAAFNSHVEAQLVSELMADASAEPRLSLIAVDEGRIVGHVLFTAARIEQQDDLSASILAPLAVTPTMQGRGVGSALVREGLQQLWDDGIDLAFVLGDPRYYGRFGFTPALPRGLLTPQPIPAEYADAWMAVNLSDAAIGIGGGQVRCADVLEQPQYWSD